MLGALMFTCHNNKAFDFCVTSLSLPRICKACYHFQLKYSFVLFCFINKIHSELITQGHPGKSLGLCHAYLQSLLILETSRTKTSKVNIMA